jgi:hypothetical protein
MLAESAPPLLLLPSLAVAASVPWSPLRLRRLIACHARAGNATTLPSPSPASQLA